MTRDEVFDHAENKETVDLIMQTCEIISEYVAFRNAIDLGLTFRHDDIDFDKALIFSWIKEESNGRRD